MEQRPLRLGDIVDDYCPRERRITNHAVVALVDQTIRQTRCGTCDAEHEYKGAREPRRRKKDTSALFEQVLENATGVRIAPRVVAPGEDAAPGPRAADADEPDTTDAEPAHASEDDDSSSARDDDPAVWTPHRTLIRATLPRTADTPPPARTIPEFTMHQRQNARFGFRQGGWNNGQPRGNGFGHGPSHGNGHGNGNGHGGGNSHPHGRGGRHRGGGGSNRAR